MPLAGDEAGAPEEIPAGDVEGPPGEPEAGEGEDSALLAVPPGSRNAPRLTPGSKGKAYKPVKNDKRNRGARSRSYASHRSAEKSSATLRNILPGSEINSLATTTGLANGVYEQNTSIYSLREQTEEGQLFQINNSIRNLIQGLDKNQEVLTEQKDENKA